ncbi:MAG: hypothetical protein EA385_07405 [Salinarimonadaceae bacterium]|nr:MAG: hypothetical protein EA385_07405 [Salinarimonadaceae bacterium]
MRAGSIRDWSEEDFGAIGVGRPRTRPARRRGVSPIGLVFGGAVVVALLTLYAPRPDGDDWRVSVVAPAPELRAPPPRWSALAIPRVTPFVSDPATADLAMRHEAYSGPDAATSRDVIQIGRFAADATHFRVAVERGDSAPPARSLFVDVALEAAQAGIAVARAVHEEPLATRRGRVEIARVQLEDGATRECLGFRDEDRALAARMSGWFCAGGVTRADLACALDAFDLVDEAASRSVLTPPVVGAATECVAETLEPAPGEWLSAAGPDVSPQGGVPIPPRRPSSL